MNIALCPTSDIPDPGSKAFELDHNGKTLAIFVIHREGQFHGYINSCPHTGINLEWQEDQFLDSEQSLIQCSMHGALFEIDTGHCIHGPCAGDNLTPVPVEIIDNRLIAIV
ncbi:MAG: Rieske 2Fe-2S domain-containing protein [Gammaproteobacteria bacterium]|nr:Rieske 2Fe-2S domain-containing protein [Gammaproteobacteria bacterium]